MKNLNYSVFVTYSAFFILSIISVIVSIAISSNFIYAAEFFGDIDLLTVSEQNNTEQGGIANLYLVVKPGSGRIFIDSYPLSKLDTQITMRFASEVACDLLEKDCSNYDFFYTITARSAVVGGPSAGAAATVLTVAVLDNQILDNNTIMTGTINSGNLIGPVAGIPAKTRIAQEKGYTQVLIPGWDNVNNTPDENLTIDVIEISTLEEALFYFTGKNYSRVIEFNEENKAEYTNIMRGITNDLCTKYAKDYPALGNIVFPSLSSYDINSTIDNVTNKSNDNFIMAADAISEGAYYSAASFCFGGNVKITTSLLKKHSSEELKLEYAKLLSNITAFKLDTESKKSSIDTISELETYMIVAERLSESSDILRNMNPENISAQQLAYAIERFNTAKVWSRFYDLPGQEFIMDQELLRIVCSKKLSEAEERLNYLDIYYPSDEIRSQLNKAYEYYSNDNYPLCIFTSSKVKAESDVVLSAIFISANDTLRLFDEKILAAEKVMSKQSEKNIFPILGYSYYEYANNLKEADVYSGLLYAEYALELSNLDMYFKKKESLSLTSQASYEGIYLFVSGMILGVGLTLVGTIYYIRNKKSRKENSLKLKHKTK